MLSSSSAAAINRRPSFFSSEHFLLFVPDENNPFVMHRKRTDTHHVHTRRPVQFQQYKPISCVALLVSVKRILQGGSGNKAHEGRIAAAREHLIVLGVQHRRTLGEQQRGNYIHIYIQCWPLLMFSKYEKRKVWNSDLVPDIGIKACVWRFNCATNECAYPECCPCLLDYAVFPLKLGLFFAQ